MKPSYPNPNMTSRTNTTDSANSSKVLTLESSNEQHRTCGYVDIVLEAIKGDPELLADIQEIRNERTAILAMFDEFNAFTQREALYKEFLAGLVPLLESWSEHGAGGKPLLGTDLQRLLGELVVTQHPAATMLSDCFWNAELIHSQSEGPCILSLEDALELVTNRLCSIQEDGEKVEPDLLFCRWWGLACNFASSGAASFELETRELSSQLESHAPWFCLSSIASQAIAGKVNAVKASSGSLPKAPLSDFQCEPPSVLCLEHLLQ